MKQYFKTPLLAFGLLFLFSSLLFGNYFIYLGNRNPIELSTQNLKNSAVSEKINIYANTGWINFKLEGKCEGSGTHSDPYIIRDLVIDGDHTGSCIIIESTTRFFKIVNCTLYNAGSNHYDAGIALLDADNGQLINNTIHTNSEHGILISWSNYISVTGNNIYNNYVDGIFVDCSNNNDVTGNIIDSNYDGIQISYGSNNRITGNTITNNNIGIHVYHSDDYFISNNIFSGNGKNTEGIPSVVNPIPPAMIALVVIVIVPILLIVIILIYKKRSSRRLEYKYKKLPSSLEIGPQKEVKPLKPKSPPEAKISERSFKSCPHCGQFTYSDAKYCIKCGQKIEEDQKFRPISEITTDEPPQKPTTDISPPNIKEKPKIPTTYKSKESEVPQMKSDDLITPLLINEEKRKIQEIEKPQLEEKKDEPVPPVMDIQKETTTTIRIYCHFCGAELNEKATYCLQCGNVIKK